MPALRLARLLGADSDEIVFTSCGTESNNLAIKGVALRAARGGTGHLVISAIEHPAVAQPAAVSGAAGLQRQRRPLRCPRRGRSGRRALRPAARHGAGEHHARQQRDRHAAADPGDRRNVPRPRGAHAHRRGPKHRQGARAGERPGRGSASRWPATRSTAPKASAPCTCAAASSWSPCCTGPATSAACARGPKTCRTSWAWAGPPR